MKKVELHTHTKHSTDSITSYEDIIKSCLDRGIDVLAVTDHNQVEGALRLAAIAPFKIIIGEEILTKEGEIIGLFLKERILPNLSMKETIKRIKDQGGIVYLPHPFDRVTRKTSIFKDSIERNINEIDIVEAYNGRSVVPWDNIKANRLADKYGKISAIGSDSHTKYEYGRNYNRIDDFNTAYEFLMAMKNAKFKKSPVLYWIFFLTKWARFINKKRLKANRAKYIEGKLSCDICGNKRFTIKYLKRGFISDQYKITDDSYGAHHQIVKCVSCNLVFAYPIDAHKEVVRRYEEFEDPEYEEERKGRSDNQIKILNNINNLFPKKGKILDVGCATGAFLEIAKKDGWEVSGVEPSKWAADIAKNKYKLPVTIGTIDDLRAKPESFDVIVCFDVIEHVNSPRSLILKMYELLKKDGLLCIVTPDKDSLIAKILGEKWWHVRPDHIFYFTERTISLLLMTTNFRIILKSRYGWSFSFDYWLSRLRKNLPLLYEIGISIKKIPILSNLSKRTYRINFQDSLELYCVKDKSYEKY